jgi:hypothetical protein
MFAADTKKLTDDEASLVRTSVDALNAADQAQKDAQARILVEQRTLQIIIQRLQKVHACDGCSLNINTMEMEKPSEKPAQSSDKK